MGNPMACSCSRHSGSCVRRDGLEREDSYKSKELTSYLTESLKRTRGHLAAGHLPGQQ